MRKSARISKKIKAIVTTSALICSFVLSVGQNYLHADADEDLVVSVAAHRGFSSQYPENTLSAFRGAVEAGASIVEFDVRITKDNQLVIYHDNTLEKIVGDDSTIADYTLDELKQMDMGSWFSSEYAGERIPTLDEALDTLAGSQVTMFVEMKNLGDSPGFGKAVYETCAAHGVLDRVVFLSFNYDYLTEIKEMNPLQPIMVLASFGKSSLPSKYPAEYYGINMKTLSPNTIKSIHGAGAKVYSYAPQTKGQVLALQRMGVDGIITDYPDIAYR